MSKIAVVTDSNSGITQERAKELGIYVLPMPFFIDGELYLEDITLTQEQLDNIEGTDSQAEENLQNASDAAAADQIYLLPSLPREM